MAVTDDVIAKCIEIEAKLSVINNLVGNAENPWWVEGDTDYTDFKSISVVQTDALAVLVTQLQALTEAS